MGRIIIVPEIITAKNYRNAVTDAVRTFAGFSGSCEISDGSALAIAEQWGQPSGHREALTQLARTRSVDVTELLDAIHDLYTDAALPQPYEDRVALDCLATWAINHD